MILFGNLLSLNNKEIKKLKKKLKIKIEQCGNNDKDNLKRVFPEDPLYFSCAQDHERDYLVGELKKEGYYKAEILNAIEHCCCKTTKRIRDKFEECVKNQLKLKRS